ncbi:MAG: PAS domain S-box protein, partial [Promethearchaeota archaeon]
MDASWFESINVHEIIDHFPLAVFITDLDGKIVKANDRAKEILSFPNREKFTLFCQPDLPDGWKISNFEDQPIIKDEMPFNKIIINKNPVQNFPLKITYPDDSQKFLLIDSFPIINKASSLQFIVILVTDVTPKEILLKEQQIFKANYEELFTNMITGYALHKIVLDENQNPIDYIFIDVNSAFTKMTNLSKNELTGKKVTSVLPGIEKDPADWIGKLGEVALTGEPISFENYSSVLNRWYKVHAYSPRPLYVVTIFSDITDIKQSQELLRQSEEKYKFLFQTVPVGLAITTMDGKAVDTNKTMSEIYGYTAEEFLSISVLSMYKDPSERERLLQLMAKYGFIKDFYTQMLDKSGNIVEILVNVEKIELQNQTCLLSSTRDITKLIQQDRYQKEIEKK